MTSPDKASEVSLLGSLRRTLVELGIDVQHAKVAVAVSGGADSMALALLLSEVMAVVALTVDHGLRSESAAEAQYVHDILHSKGMKHHILTWNGDKPKSNIQSEARAARYKLMEDWCASEDIQYLLTAHHVADQAETFMLRLARGSGVYGLSAIEPVSEGLVNKDVTIVRPLINTHKELLETYLKRNNIEWIEDPSNLNNRYDRVKIREFFKAPVLDGFTVERVAQTSSHMRRVRTALEYYQKMWIDTHVKFDAFGAASFERASLNDIPEEIILRSLASIVRQVSGNAYVPRFEKLSTLYEILKANPDLNGDDYASNAYTGSTLLGTCISLKENIITVCREVGHISEELIVSGSDSITWDNRFMLGFASNSASSNVFAEKLIVKPLRKEGWNEILQKYPAIRDDEALMRLAYQVKLSLPAIFDASGLRAVPHLGYNDLENINITVSLLSGVLSKK